MKVGSLVELVAPFDAGAYRAAKQFNLTFPQIHEECLIEEIVVEYGITLLRLEGYNSKSPRGGGRIGYNARKFKEIKPPMDVEALIEECKTYRHDFHI